MEIVIRRATAADAEAVHEIVLRALRETNARDYSSSVIDRLVLTLPDKVASNLETWCAFVAIVNGQVVGTGSLNGQTVSSVYVHPDHQRRGIATKLMDAVENAANAQSHGDVECPIVGYGKILLRKAWFQDRSGRILW